MARAAFSFFVPVAAIATMYLFWGGRPHPGSELGFEGWIWLFSSAAALSMTPVWAALYPWWTRTSSAWPRVLVPLIPVVFAVVAAYLGVGLVFFVATLIS